MANEPDSQDASVQKPKRKPITIDLPAEEIGRKGVAEEVSDSSSEPPSPAEAASGSVDDGQKAEPASAESDRPASEERTSPAEPVTPSAFAGSKPEAGAPKAPKWRPMPEPPPPPPPRPIVPMLAAAIAGGVVGAAIIAALVLSGYFGQADEPGLAAEIDTLKSEVAGLRQAQPTDLIPLQEQVAALEKSVSELTQTPPSGAADAALTELQGRVAALEETGGTNSSTGDLETRIAELSETVAALKNAAPADAGSLENALAPIRQEVQALSTRLDQAPTGENIAAIEQKLDQVSSEVGASMALAPAVAAAALAAALESGRPFSNELEALGTLGTDPAAVEELTSRAAAGLPTMAQLRSSFEAAIASVDLAPPIPEAAGTLDRLWQSARGLVEVRPARPTEGTDPTAIVTRIRGALGAADLKTALAEREALPDSIKTATADWASDAEARMTADNLVAAVRAEALGRLGAGQ